MTPRKLTEAALPLPPGSVLQRQATVHGPGQVLGCVVTTTTGEAPALGEVPTAKDPSARSARPDCRWVRRPEPGRAP